VVILVIGILAAVASPTLLATTQDSAVIATITSLRTIEDAALRYFAANGKLPADAGPGQFPSDLTGYLRKSGFLASPAIGGKYDWNGPGTAVPVVGISIHWSTASAVPLDRCQQIDDRIDDGDLSTGEVRLISSGSERFLQLRLRDN